MTNAETAVQDARMYRRWWRMMRYLRARIAAVGGATVASSSGTTVLTTRTATHEKDTT